MKSSTPFLIKFGELHLPVTPQHNVEGLHYVITLTSKTIELYQQTDRSNITYWYQRGIGRTALAEQLGYLIESHLLNLE